MSDDRNIRAAERQHDLNTDVSKRLVEASTRDAQEAIKIVFIINSGAAVAILAFIATLASRSSITLANLKAVIHSLYWFIGGIIFAATTSVLAYLCNQFYSAHLSSPDKIWEHPYVRENARSRRELRLGRIFNWIALGLGVVALALFIRGVYVAAQAIERLVATNLPSP
jgi:hypothetical protein